MSRYIHQLPDWPGFRWGQEALAAPLAEIRHRQGRLLGRMEGLGFALRKEAELETLTLDLLKSSEIRSMSRCGWSGSWAASAGRSMGPRRPSRR